MRTILSAISAVLLAATVQAQQGQAQPAQGQGAPAIELKTTKQRASYGIGMNIGNNMRRSGFDLDLAALMRGLTDALAGAKPALAAQEIQESINAAQQEAVAVQEERKKQLAAKNKQDAADFLAKNKQQQGVTTLPSGLQYKVIKSGTGQGSPKATDTVTTHYKGTLLDGTVFDSSYDRGEPASFGVNQVIPGWTEALQKMKVGDKWQLFIPAELGYGERGTPNGEIGPNATLVFDIELLAVEPAKPAKP